VSIAKPPRRQTARRELVNQLNHFFPVQTSTASFCPFSFSAHFPQADGHVGRIQFERISGKHVAAAEYRFAEYAT
jgi:hypothetical protein